MNFKLTRTKSALYGIIGTMTSEDGAHSFVTLEHAYACAMPNVIYVPKVAPGTYTCVRHAPNRLPYWTFMLEGVPPFQGAAVTGILIHIGNYTNDSIGCILLGLKEGTGMIEDSKDAFEAFMALQDGIDSFQLTVV